MFFKLFLLLVAVLSVGANVLSKAGVQMDGTLVAAQLRCQGFLCPKWALDVTRYDPARQLGVEYLFKLAELLPLAPTAQRSSNVWTAYRAETREFTVGVQSYPGPGMDTFFSVEISGDVSSAKVLRSNVIVGHPDGANGSPGSMYLIKVLYCPKGGVLALFNDGSLHRLDMDSKTYTPLASLSSPAGSMTSAGLMDGPVLKSIFYDSATYTSYLLRADISQSPAKIYQPLKLQPLRGRLGNEKPIATHITYDPNTNTSQLAVVYAGNFDMILKVDEETGAQTAISSDITNEANGGIPVQFECNTDIKECDTIWSTSAYDAKNNVLYFQIHQSVDDMSVAYIYNAQYYKNKINPDFYPVINPSEPITFGFSGYQWVTFAQ